MNARECQPIPTSVPGATARLALSLWVVASSVFIAGCGTQNNVGKPFPPPRDNIADTQQIAGESLRAVQPALRTLDQISTLTDPCPPRLFDQLIGEAHRLSVDSLKVRARARAVQARGPAYFEQWHTNLARHPEPKVRAAAVAHREHLNESFRKIEQSLQTVSEAFQPFLTGVRRLVNALERDPASARADSTRNLIRSAMENGHKVEAGLVTMIKELDSVAGLLSSTKPQ